MWFFKISSHDWLRMAVELAGSASHQCTCQHCEPILCSKQGHQSWDIKHIASASWTCSNGMLAPMVGSNLIIWLQWKIMVSLFLAMFKPGSTLPTTLRICAWRLEESDMNSQQKTWSFASSSWWIENGKKTSHVFLILVSWGPRPQLPLCCGNRPFWLQTK